MAAVSAPHRPAAVPDPSRLRLRIALGVVAVLHLALAIPSLFFGDDAGAPVHVAHELGSWDMALSVGFLFAAVRPARAWGMVPLVTALVASLLLTSGLDVSEGQAAVWREAAHSLEIAGLALLWLLARRPMFTRRADALVA
jgi:predicted anti-sigma-YlaC factor YlaD